MRKLFTLFFLFVLPSFCLANGDKAPDVVVTFHLESAPVPGKKMTFNWQTMVGRKHFRISSEFKTSDIVGHRPFPSPHVEDQYGMIFKFDRDAKRRLHQLTINNNGKHLIVFMNGKPVDMLKIDKPVDDGIICVWRGLLPSDVHKADKLVPRIGEDKKVWKKRRKEEIKAAKNKK